VQELLSEEDLGSSTNQLPLSQKIIRPWEEIRKNKHRTNIGYEKDVTFNNPYYTNPIQFQSARLLQDISYSHASVQEKIQKFQHCQQFGQIEYQCFDFHPYENCGKKNHPSNRCFNNKKSAILNKHYGWIPSWQWSPIVKKICQSYRRMHSRVSMHLVVKGFASSYLIHSREEQHQRLIINRAITSKCDYACGHPKPPHLVEDFQLLLDNGLWFPLNIHLVEEFQLLLHQSLWSCLNQHQEHFQLAEDKSFHLLANLGNVLVLFGWRGGMLET